MPQYSLFSRDSPVLILILLGIIVFQEIYNESSFINRIFSTNNGIDDASNFGSNHGTNDGTKPVVAGGEKYLVRCYWPGMDEEEVQKRLNILKATVCPKTFCTSSETSQRAYSSFLVEQTIKSSNKKLTQETNFDRIVEDTAQCLFFERQDDKLCSCDYPSFLKYCEEFFFSTKTAKLEWTGDSTIRYFVQYSSKACKSVFGAYNYTTEVELDKVEKLPTVLVVNEKTLHHLDIPFVAFKGERTYLKSFVYSPSVEHFLFHSEELLRNITQEYTLRKGDLAVYMANNIVCDNRYVKTWDVAINDLMVNEPNVQNLQEFLKNRENLPRGDANGAAILGLTLDLPGSRFANRLLYDHVFLKLQEEQKNAGPSEFQWAYLPFANGDQPMCELTQTGDGRHYLDPKISHSQKGYKASFFVTKARLLHHAIAGVTGRYLAAQD